MIHRSSWCAIAAALLIMLSCRESTPPPPSQDATAPGEVLDLTLSEAAPGTVTLAWTASGDDGSVGTAAAYDLRYSVDSLTASAWDSATVVPSSRFPLPSGSDERWTITELAADVRYFALRVADEVPNWSQISNVVRVEVAPVIPPLRVSDLRVESTGASSITLAWTAPGSATTIPQATEYDLRYARSPITLESWAGATRIDGVAAPAAVGTTESFTVISLTPMVTYYFAIRAADGEEHWSDLSNVVSESILLTALTRLTTSSRRIGAIYPAWCPDGSSIAFAADWDHQYHFEVYLMSPTGGETRKLTDEALDDAYMPAWSSDGARLAYVCPGRYQLVVLELRPGGRSRAVATHNGQTVLWPSWSPDGTRIAYCLSDFPSTGYEIYTVSTTGGPPSLLAGREIGGTSSAWSPDGSQIAFSSSNGIWVMPAAGGAPTLLTEDMGGGSPAWSPDGTRIAFSSTTEGNTDIWVMTSWGENPVRVTTSPSIESFPSWSPDGHALCFTRQQDGVSDIWIVPLE